VSCWPGQAGGGVTKPVLVVATGDNANDSEKCGCSTKCVSPSGLHLEIMAVRADDLHPPLIGQQVGFCHSDAPQVEPWHVPKPPGLDDPASVAVLHERVVPLARRAWADLSDPEGRLRFTDDCYLKLWQLSDPRLPADYVLLDEA
jgi:hypothetical protein